MHLPAKVRVFGDFADSHALCQGARIGARIAKGAHRKTKAGASKFGGGVDLLDTGQAVFTDAPERDLATLTEWQLLDGRLELRKSLRVFMPASTARNC